MNGLITGVMVAFAVAIGCLTGSPVPVGVAGVLLVAHVFSVITSRNAPNRMSVDRETDGQMVEVGTSILARVRIKTSGSMPLRWMLIRDRVSDGVLVDAATGRLSFGAHDLSEGFFYRATFPRRGIYTLGPAEVSSGDLMGIRASEQMDTRSSQIVVHPRVVPMTPFRLPSSRPFGDLQSDPKSNEDPTRPSGCRPYAYGDPMKRIHWAATARTGALVSRLYDGSSSPVTSVIVDCAAKNYANAAEFELACCVAASLLSALLRDGAEAGLVGSDVPSAVGDLHLERCLAALATFQISNADFADQLVWSRESLPWRPSLVVISPGFDERAGAALDLIRTAGGTIAIVAIGERDDRANKSMEMVAALGGSVMRIRREEELASKCFVSANAR